MEDLDRLATAMELPVIEPEWLGANLVLRDIPDFSHLPPGSRLFFPDTAVLVVTEQNLPCVHPGNIIQMHYPDTPRLAQNSRRRRSTCAVSSPASSAPG